MTVSAGTSGFWAIILTRMNLKSGFFFYKQNLRIALHFSLFTFKFRRYIYIIVSSCPVDPFNKYFIAISQYFLIRARLLLLPVAENKSWSSAIYPLINIFYLISPSSPSISHFSIRNRIGRGLVHLADHHQQPVLDRRYKRRVVILIHPPHHINSNNSMAARQRVVAIVQVMHRVRPLNRHNPHRHRIR